MYFVVFALGDDLIDGLEGRGGGLLPQQVRVVEPLVLRIVPRYILEGAILVGGAAHGLMDKALASIDLDYLHVPVLVQFLVGCLFLLEDVLEILLGAHADDDTPGRGAFNALVQEAVGLVELLPTALLRRYLLSIGLKILGL
mmetsp:Transcript_23578/g.23237  ORF Transcript_23578/g.23237 Transcript_23578/m.23237 type:complete len:142 (-) Transcript_23578:2090-2515(-)